MVTRNYRVTIVVKERITDCMAKVLSLVSYTFLPAKMGGQKCIAYTNGCIAKHLPLLAVTTRRNDGTQAGYEVLNVLGTSNWRYINPFYFFLLRRIIRRHDITHLIIEHPYYGWLALLLKWFCGLRLIVRSHNIEALRFKSTGKWWWRILHWYEGFTHRRADFSFFITAEDRDYAVQQYRVAPARCAIITYGIERVSAPPATEQAAARAQLAALHNIAANETIFLFNGTLDYLPNLNALKIILDVLNPQLLQWNMPYKVIICGRFLPAAMDELRAYAGKNIIYAGFVEDISTYFKGADVFLNPVTEGGGIKTKLVEAIGYGLNAVSTVNGALGVDPAICGGKLRIAPDGDWTAFATQIREAMLLKAATPAAFYDHFYWGNIGRKAAAAITAL